MSQRDVRVIGGVYRIGQIISAGGVMRVYTAYNHNTNDVVGLYVIELPSPKQMQVVQQMKPFLDKRRQIRSAHIIRIYDWGIDDNRIFIATDPPRGITLQHLFDHDTIDIARAIDLIRQLATGLQTLHEQGIAGLDLRPQLITVDTVGMTDRVQIDDIGLRSLLLMLGYVSSQRNDDIGYLDPRYATPEYIYGRQIGPWSDIYQAGLLLFTLVTGRQPFVGSTPAETAMMQSNSPVPPMSQYQHATPAILQSLVERALEKDPAKRFANATLLISALNDVASSLRGKEQNETLVASQPSTSLTSEIPREDVTKLAMHVERSSAIPLAATEKPIPNVPTEEGIYAYLCYEANGEQPQRFAIIQKDTVIGRLDPKRGVRPDIDLSTLDPTMTISRLHARIRFEETFFYIEDLKSRNKTRLGRSILTPLKAELLQHGDHIQFGSVPMRFEVQGVNEQIK
jgi:serine/threonine protein kinase